MTDTLLALQQLASPLEPDAQQRESLRNAVVQYAENFLTEMPHNRAWRNDAGTGEALLDFPVSDAPREIHQLLELLRTEVDTPGLNPASGGHLGYIPGGGIYTSSLGDYLADITNRYAGVFFAGPGAVRMENLLLRWIMSLVGYDTQKAGGNLCSGGSIANLTGLVCARDAKQIKARDIEQSVIYLTSQVHHSVHKAIRIAGLGECPVRHIPMDGHFRMDASALNAQVEKDKKEGLKPFLVVASAGTTDTGSVDPIAAIADIAQAHGLWLHVDAAYGGFFILTQQGKEKIKGLDRCDSIVLDPHKGLFLPYGTGAILVKDKNHLLQSHYYLANYMQDTVNAQEEMSPADLSPELTKHFRGLRMWLPLMVHGLAPFRAALEEKLLLTRWFRQEISAVPGMEVGPEPDLSVTFFRITRSGQDPETLNEDLLRRIHADGRVFLSSTRIHGQLYIRFACLCFRTHLHTAQTAVQMIREALLAQENEGV